MVTLVKHEWHQVDAQFAYELDMDTLAQIYPDMKKKELKAVMKEIENGEYDIDTLVSDAQDNDVEIEWDRQYDDWWTDRKGGYDVTYELGDEDSYHTEPEPSPPSIKCTKCRWEGNNYETRTTYVNEQGEVLPDDCEEWHDTKDVCPMCDSEVALTEYGQQEKEARDKRMAELDALLESTDENE